MRRLILAAALCVPAAVAIGMGHHASALAPPEQLPACKSGWKADADLHGQVIRYIPVQFVFRAPFSGNGIRVVDDHGHVVATLGHGQQVSFDCFDLPVGDTI